MIEFPIIETIEDVLPYLKGRDEFIVAEREGYKVINYNVNFEDTFLHPEEVGIPSNEKLARQMRRECRGIIFCSKSGKILRRPYHKFKNVGEAPETQPHLINLSNDHVILEKLDGSMIAPFYVGENLIWGTKMGDTDVAKPVQEFVRNNPKYVELAEDCIRNRRCTPIFEWCSRKQRIVIDHPEDRLVLTAARDLLTGKYVSFEHLWSWGDHWNIPVVDIFDSRTDINEFLNHVQGLQDLEGFVVRFDDGHMVKIKCDWYCQIHKAKEAILQDRNIVELILDQKLDDIKPHLLPEDVARLNKFESDVNHQITLLAKRIYDFAVIVQKQGDRKAFALGVGTVTVGFTRAIVFSTWDNLTEESVLELVKRTVRNNLSRNTKWDELQEAWFPDLEPYNS